MKKRDENSQLEMLEGILKKILTAFFQWIMKDSKILRKIKRLFILLAFLFLDFSCWDRCKVSGFPDLGEIIQYKMDRGSGSSSSKPFPRWNVDLNQPPREEVEVPVEEAPTRFCGKGSIPN